MRLFGWAGLGTLSVIMLLQLRGMDTPLQTATTPLGVVGYELAFTPDRAAAMLETWRSLDRLEALRVSLGFDAIFLLVYPWFLRRSMQLVAQRRGTGSDRLARVGAILATAVLACTLLDATENVALWRMTETPPTWTLTLTAGLAASIKFLLIAASIVWSTIGLVTSRHGVR